MTNDVSDLITRSEELLMESHRFAYAARAIELQRDAADRLHSCREEIRDEKRAAQAETDESSANVLLAADLVLQSVESELRMFVALKEERPDEAWDHLISAQNALASALRVRPEIVGLDGLVEELSLHERNLFPPQLFMSPAMTVGYSECSICNGAYGECEHVAGRAYMGELCARVISEVTRVSEVSVVEHPKDKRRRIVFLTDDDGVQRDFLSWRVVDAPDAANGRTPGADPT